jgi:hypothetical protein
MLRNSPSAVAASRSSGRRSKEIETHRMAVVVLMLVICQDFGQDGALRRQIVGSWMYTTDVTRDAGPVVTDAL